MSTAPQLSIESLPAWAALHDVKLQQVGMRHIDGEGHGLVAEDELSASENPDDFLEILRVPADLVLSGASVEEYAKVDHNFKQLLEAVGRKSTRLHIMMYLLVHVVSGRHAGDKTRRCVSSPWSEYIRFLPRDIPVPTLWTIPHKFLLGGTSLETALAAKAVALKSEFDSLRDKSATLPFWNQLLWEEDGATLPDWLLVDAWYRSRCLELPHAGEAMVPALDMVNHSGGGSATAYYEEEASGDVSLRVRPGAHVPAGGEVTISYGDDKSAAEMLFSYGFIDSKTTTQKLTLLLDNLLDDPLARAKLRVFGSGAPPVVTMRRGGGDAATLWESEFVHLMCLNEEDGLEFRLLQDDAGGREVRVFWQEEDVTARAHEFESLLRDHPLASLFRLRAVTVVQDRAVRQLQKLKRAFTAAQPKAVVSTAAVDKVHVVVDSLRGIERSILEGALVELVDERSQLVQNESVVAYLRSMEDGGCSMDKLAEHDTTTLTDDGDDNDFS